MTTGPNGTIDGGVNPIKSDPELQTLVKKLDSIKKYYRFQKWKKAFVDRLEKFLYEEGMTPAQKGCNDFDAILKKFVKMANKVQGFIDKGDLSDEKKTVKAALALSELCNTLKDVNHETEQLVPPTARDERKRGFTKFHVGAVLIRQGFHQYLTMNIIKDALTQIGTSISEVLDKQQHEMFAAYVTQLERFCAVMADLNLYEIMLKCIQFLEEPEDESEDPEPVEVTVKTHDGKSFKLIFELNETVLNIKQIVQANGYDVPPDKQILSFRGSPLTDDSQTVEDAKLEDGATLMVEPLKIPIIIVDLSKNKSYELLVNPCSPMREIKSAHVAEASGLEEHNQVLSMNGIELGDDDQTLEFYGIQAKSVLELQPRTIQVSVTRPDGEPLLIELSPRKDSVASIKSKIESASGIVVPRQMLSYQGSDLLDDQMIKDIGITGGSKLGLDFVRVPIKVENPDGSSFEVLIDPYDSMSALKSQLEKESGIAVANQCVSMNGVDLVGDDKNTASFYGIGKDSVLGLRTSSIEILVNMPDGASLKIEVQPTRDCLLDIKEKIAAVSGVSAKRQVVSLEGQVLKRSDKILAEDLGVKDGSFLDIDIFRIPVTVRKMDGEAIEVMIDPTDTIGSIKKELEAKTGIAADNQKLLLDELDLSDNDKTATDYGVKSHSEITLEPKTMAVNITMPDGTNHTIDISPDCSVSEIKSKIEDETSMPVSQQVLSVGSKPLASGTARELGINPETNIQVSVRKVPVTIQTYGGGSFQAMIDPTVPLSALKKSLQKEANVPAENQILFMENSILSDDTKTALDHGVTEGSTLCIEPKTMTLKARLPNGDEIDIEVSPSDSVETVKKEVEGKSGMKCVRQVLSFNDQNMQNQEILRDLGIKPQSTIIVATLKISIVVRNMDGKEAKFSIEPTESIASLKKAIAKDFGILPNNQKLLFREELLKDDKMSVEDCGIKAGSKLLLEPISISIEVQMPDGTKAKVVTGLKDTVAQIKTKIEATTGMKANRQVLQFADGQPFPSDPTKTAQELGLREGSDLVVGIFKIPITVKTPDGNTLSLQTEPTDTINTVKKFVEKETAIAPMKQCLKFGSEEMENGKRQLQECGISAGSILTLELHVDPIIFLDIKTGSLFGVDREDVVKNGLLTTIENNKMDFVEATKDSSSKEKIKKALLSSPKLGVATQVVVEKGEVEEYDLKEAEKVSNMWGVKLKKREKNEAGEEFVFVDIKTGATGELSRKKYIDNGFLTPEADTIKEAESDTQTYDKFVAGVRQVFGVQVAS